MKRTIAAMLLMAVMSFLPMAAGATNNKVSDGDKIYTVAEQMPSFKGNGAKWISQNLRKPVGKVVPSLRPRSSQGGALDA